MILSRKPQPALKENRAVREMSVKRGVPENDAPRPSPSIRRVGFALYLLATAILLIVVMILGVTIGSVEIPLSSVLRALGRGITGSVGATSDPVFTIVWLLRMPRAVMAALVGASLGVAGAQMQGLFQNPLASPDIIGVSAGGSLGGVIALATGLAARSMFYLPLLAFSGSLAALIAVYGIATRRARTGVATLLLAGVAVSTLIGAITSFLITVTWVRYEVAQQIIFWLMGGLANRTWTHVWLGIPGFVPGIVLALAYARDLDILAAGEEVASSLGMEVERAKRTLLVNSALLTGTAVALSGAIGFVGLVVPHAVRLVIGPAHKRLLPASAVSGAAFLVFADLLARTLDRPEELQVGIITAFFGAPFFLYLLMHRSREEFYV
jgi:iron complex transport system permease protein